jgi:hypothetical protein
MAQMKSSKAQEFDSIVIGGGLSGLIIAHQLEATGRKVALVDALDVLGGNSRPSKSAIGQTDHGLKFFPATPAALENLQWLETVLGESIGIQELDAPPITYDSGKFQPFVGFGEFTPEAAAELNYFAAPKQLITEKTPKDWVTRLSESFTGDIFLQSHVTSLQYDDSFIIEATVNGTKKLSAREYIFCAAPNALGAILPENIPSSRQRLRLLKGKFFTSVYLDLVHAKPITESRQLHMLKGANEEPLAGVFRPAVTREDGTTVQQSQWVTFIRADLTDDPEETANALKNIKRQVKRIYETAFEGLISERILLNPSSHGELEGMLAEDARWPKIDNLWVASNFFNPNRNLVGTLDQARKILQTMPDLITDADIEPSKRPEPGLTI